MSRGRCGEICIAPHNQRTNRRRPKGLLLREAVSHDNEVRPELDSGDGKRFGASVGPQGKSDTTGVPTAPPLVEAAAALTLANFDGASHDDHVVNAAPLAACAATHVSFIGLDDFAGLAADPVLVWTHHDSPEFVKNLEGGLITRQSELPLKLDGRLAWCLTGNQIGRPEPHREWRVRAVHDGAASEVSVASALPATEYTGTRGDAIRLTVNPAVRADESSTPPSALKIGSARHPIWKELLEFRQRARKRLIIPLKYVDSHGCSCVMQMLNRLR